MQTTNNATPATVATVAPVAAPAKADAPAKAAKPRNVKTAAKPRAAKPAPAAVAAPAKLSPDARNAAKAEQRAALAATLADARIAAAALYRAADTGALSIPVKPMQAFGRTYKRDVTAHAIGRKPSVRQAAALAVAALSSGIKLADGAQFSRQFTRNGTPYAIENGALSDCLASGLCTYNAKTETITLRNAAQIASLIGTVKLPA